MPPPTYLLIATADSEVLAVAAESHSVQRAARADAVARLDPISAAGGRLGPSAGAVAGPARTAHACHVWSEWNPPLQRMQHHPLSD